MRKRFRKRIPPSVLGHMGKVGIFEFFSKIIPPQGGGCQPKKVFHRDQREAHAKFGLNPSSSLGSKSEETNIYIYRFLVWERKFLFFNSEKCVTQNPGNYFLVLAQKA